MAAPCFLLITAGWYKRSEQLIRQVLWFGGTPTFGFIGSLIAFGLGHSRSSVAPWKLMFLDFGALGFILGVVIFFFLPDSPENAFFLNEHEKLLARA